MKNLKATYILEFVPRRWISCWFCLQVNLENIIISFTFHEYWVSTHFLASRFSVYCGVTITLASFPYLLNILHLMMLFILTEYGGCSNSKRDISEYVFNCLQNNQWAGFRKPMTGSPSLFSFSFFLFSFCFGYVTFSSYWAHIRVPSFLVSIIGKKGPDVCVFLKEPWINLHNFEQSCLPAVISFWHQYAHQMFVYLTMRHLLLYSQIYWYLPRMLFPLYELCIRISFPSSAR